MYDTTFITKREEESGLQYGLRMLAAFLAIVVIAPVVALTLVLVPAMLVLELPPFLLAVLVGVLVFGLIRLKQGFPAARRAQYRDGSHA